MCEHIEGWLKKIKPKYERGFVLLKACNKCRECFVITLPQKHVISRELANKLGEIDTITVY